MPAPSLTKSSDINTELGKGSTTILRLGDANTRNLACVSSGTIKYGNCRWGINFPGGEMYNTLGFNPSGPTYDATSTLLIAAQEQILYDGVSYAQGYSEIRFFSNGVMRLQSSTAGGGPTNYHKTWLTSGAAGDYTVQFQRTAGAALTGGSSAANTDLAMSTDRFFALNVQVGPGVDAASALTFGNLIVKDGGGTLITRPIELSSFAEIF
jgi:hypothetical protein